MEWPAHQLLRQQCDVESGSSASESSTCEDCIASTAGGAHKKIKIEPCDSASSHGFASTPAVALPAHLKHTSEESTEPDTPQDSLQHQHVHHPHPRGHRRWKKSSCSSYSRLDGWYVLLAEILGTIILIAICVVAARQVGRAAHRHSCGLLQAHGTLLCLLLISTCGA